MGVIIDGKLIRYTFGTAGELGSIVVNAREGKPSFLGGLGGLESVASARAIVEAATFTSARTAGQRGRGCRVGPSTTSRRPPSPPGRLVAGRRHCQLGGHFLP